MVCLYRRREHLYYLIDLGALARIPVFGRAAMAVSSVDVLSRELKPLCQRDNHPLKYESGRSRSNPEHQSSYHCGFEGCSVRYDPTDGYYTLLGVDEQVYRLEEPGVNTLKCPVHNCWLYRQQDLNTEAGVRWCCGIEHCHYCFNAPTKGDWVRT